jgi:hypothetical protein
MAPHWQLEIVPVVPAKLSVVLEHWHAAGVICACAGLRSFVETTAIPLAKARAKQTNARYFMAFIEVSFCYQLLNHIGASRFCEVPN